MKSLDLARKQATDDQGTVYSFEKLLLATGGEPRVLPFGSDKIIYYRTVGDYRRLRALTETRQTVHRHRRGIHRLGNCRVTGDEREKGHMLFPGPSIGNRIYPRALSQFLNRYYQEKGVTVAPEETATALEERKSELVIKTKSGREFAADGVIAGLGIEPNTGLARERRA